MSRSFYREKLCEIFSTEISYQFEDQNIKRKNEKMAKYDAIRIRGKIWLGSSNEQSVGAGGRNNFGDVLLIQAMLRYLAAFTATRSGTAVPELTGVFDAVTGEAIRNFQQEFSVRLFQPDGIIHPPSYAGRDLKNPFNPLMTMTYLHILCKHQAKYYGHARYAIGITMLFPQLLLHLRHPGVATVPFLA